MNRYGIQNLQASFRGVPFGIRNESITETGNRLILHEYPNSKIRYVENIGQIPPKFSVEAFVYGNDWKQKATQLEHALQQSGKGRLILPVLGSFLVYALPYSVNSSQRSVGEIRFSLAFAAGTISLAPITSTATIQRVFDNADYTRIALEKELITKYSKPISVPNILTAQYDTLSFIEKFKDTLSKITSESQDIVNAAEDISRNIAKYTNDITSLSNQLFSVVKTPLSFFQAISTALARSASSVRQLVNLTKFGSDLTLSLTAIKRSFISILPGETNTTKIPYWPSTTAERIKRNNNRKVIVESARCGALIAAYEQAALANYLTKEQVQENRKLIEDAYKTFVLDQSDDKDSIRTTTDVRDTLGELRTSSLAILAQKEQQAYSIIELELLSPIPVTVLAYKLYAEQFTSANDLDTMTELIRNLNTNQPSTAFFRTVEVLQKGR